MIEEQTVDGFEPLNNYWQITNCSHNYFNINLCSFEEPGGFNVVDSVEFALCVFFYSVTMLFGIVCNVLVLAAVVVKSFRRVRTVSIQSKATRTTASERPTVIMTASYDGQKTVVDDTLICLCLSDLFIIGLCIPVRLVRWFTYTWTFGGFLCKTVYYLQYWSAAYSVMIITFLALQRYYAAVHPLIIRTSWTARSVRLTLLLICIASATLTLPLLFGQIHRPIGLQASHFWCVTEFESDWQLILFEIYMFLLLVCVPLATMTTVYAFLLCKIRQPLPYATVNTAAAVATLARKADSAAPAEVQHRLRTVTFRLNSVSFVGNRQRVYLRMAQMLSLSVVVFAICWAPYQTDRLLSALGVTKKFNVGWLKHLRMATTLLAHANACLNPLIYSVLSPHFRKSMGRILSRKAS